MSRTNNTPLSHDVRGTGSGAVSRGHVDDHKEYNELNFRAIFQFMGGLLVIVLFCFVAMYGLFEVFEDEYEKKQPPLSPVAQEGWNNPGPEVQAAPNVVLSEHESVADSALEGEGTGALTMPIDRAMTLVADEGLPYRAEDQSSDEDQDATE